MTTFVPPGVTNTIYEVYLSTAELAARWRKSTVTLKRWRGNAYGPAWKKFPPRTVLYPMTAILEWESRTP